MTLVRRSIDPISCGLVVGCAAWLVPQQYVGAYRGLFSVSVQTFLSLTILVGLGAWAFQVVRLSVSNRAFPWGAAALLLVSLAGVELIWRLLIAPLPDGDSKIAWLTMLFIQPVLAALSAFILARSWRSFFSRRGRGR